MKEITIAGQSCPIHFGLRAVNEFTKLQGGDFEETVSTTGALGSLDSIVSLAVSGLNEGARRTNSDRRYTEDEVWDIFDEEPQLILTVSEIFMESIAPLTDKLGNLVSPNGTRPAKGNRKR